jgi:magnesium transporter
MSSALHAGPITLGVLTAIVTSAIQSLGLTLQRKSHVTEELLPPAQRRRPFGRGLWRLGLLIFLSSNILGSTVQITTLPLVILAPLQAGGLIFNAVFASVFLGEGFTLVSLAGTVLVSVGAGLIAGFGALQEPSHGIGELLDMFSRTPFLAWMSVQGGIVVCILVMSRVLLRVIRRKSTAMDNTLFSSALGRTIKRLKIVRGCILGCLSGMISGHCLLLAKAGAELIILSIFTKNQFSQWQSWMILLGFLILELAQVTLSLCGLTQLYYLNSGLRLCSTTILYPLIFCVYNITSIFDGLIYYQQASRLTTLQITFVAIGTTMLLPGVLCLSWRLPSDIQPPITPLSANPFATVPEFELFTDDVVPEDIVPEIRTPIPRRRSRVVSYDEVEGLRDLLGDMDDDRSEETIEEEAVQQM